MPLDRRQQVRRRELLLHAAEDACRAPAGGASRRGERGARDIVAGDRRRRSPATRGERRAAASRGRIGGRDQRLPAALEQVEEALAALVVELAQDVVEQQDRQRRRGRREQIALREQQGEQGEPLLALRAERRSVATVERRARGRPDGARAS